MGRIYLLDTLNSAPVGFDSMRRAPAQQNGADQLNY